MSRSGTTIFHPNGYKSFIPTDLPPLPQIHFTEELQQLLSEADRQLARLDGIGFSLPNRDLFLSMYVRKEALLSSQIEGTQATMNDLLTFETWNEVDNLDDVQEVVNYIHALNRGVELLDELPLGLRIIKEMHKLLLQGSRGQHKCPGEFRRSQNWIGPSLKEAIFIPPPPEEALAALSALERYFHEEDELPPLARCALIHYQFETIHPFLDGNGRIGRLLIVLYLLSTKTLEHPLLYISYYLKLHRQEYFDRLMGVRLSGDYEQWIGFFLKAVRRSAEEAITRIKSVLILRNTLRDQIKGKPGASLKTLDLLDLLFEHPITTTKKVANWLTVSHTAASSQIKLLKALSILTESPTTGREKRYYFSDYLDLIA